MMTQDDWIIQNKMGSKMEAGKMWCDLRDWWQHCVMAESIHATSGFGTRVLVSWFKWGKGSFRPNAIGGIFADLSRSRTDCWEMYLLKSSCGMHREKLELRLTKGSYCKQQTFSDSQLIHYWFIVAPSLIYHWSIVNTTCNHMFGWYNSWKASILDCDEFALINSECQIWCVHAL